MVIQKAGIEMKDYSFGNYICALRRGRGLSQIQLGTLVGVTDKAISKWENGDAKPKLATCIRLANVLEVPIDELLSCKEQNTTLARKDINKMNQGLWKEAYRRLSVYGENPPALCWSRLAAEEATLRETNEIQSFYILGRIEEEAQKNHCVFWASDTLSSSFAAWLLGATKVNPLPPHYRCPNCGKTEFISGISDGFDLPEKHCTCGAEFLRDGHNIPFEAHLAAKQRGTHVEFRVSEAFKPIATSVIKTFYEGNADVIPIKLMRDGCPLDVDSYVVFSEHNRQPALSEDGTWHMETSEHWHLLRSEHPLASFILIPSEQMGEIQAMQQMTGTRIPDPLSLFTKPLMERLYRKRLDAYPVFSSFLSAEENLDFSLLLKMEGFTHSSETWIKKSSEKHLFNNSEASFHGNGIPLRRLPVLREDLWLDISRALMQEGISDHSLAMQIMEVVGRRGKYATQGMPVAIENVLRSLDLPEWYPEYLKSVLYLFPKGHCVAYLLIDAIFEWYLMTSAL